MVSFQASEVSKRLNSLENLSDSSMAISLKSAEVLESGCLSLMVWTQDSEVEVV